MNPFSTIKTKAVKIFTAFVSIIKELYAPVDVEIFQLFAYCI